jgi:D-tyrosyl-tRNA(Tyr) deacylase
MRIIVQRVKSARVRIDNVVTASIECGLLLLVGISKVDRSSDAAYLADKIAGLRIFPDEQGKMNRDVREAGGAILIVSNFTVYGDCRKGRRPSFDVAAAPDAAKVLYEDFVKNVKSTGIHAETGVFREHMLVELENDGPITLICESPENRPEK